MAEPKENLNLQGLRGATTTKSNEVQAIEAAVKQLLEEFSGPSDARSRAAILLEAVPDALHHPLRTAWLLEEITRGGSAAAMLPGALEVH